MSSGQKKPFKTIRGETINSDVAAHIITGLKEAQECEEEEAGEISREEQEDLSSAGLVIFINKLSLLFKLLLQCSFIGLFFLLIVFSFAPLLFR